MCIEFSVVKIGSVFFELKNTAPILTTGVKSLHDKSVTDDVRKKTPRL